MTENATRCVVWSETGRTVALVGTDNLAVIDLPDALLIVDRTHAQDVRKLVARMEQEYPDLT
jgi:mannose-1-phosphate guanylyltransferase/mannose-6-phosphate isomerase